VDTMAEQGFATASPKMTQETNVIAQRFWRHVASLGNPIRFKKMKTPCGIGIALRNILLPRSKLSLRGIDVPVPFPVSTISRLCRAIVHVCIHDAFAPLFPLRGLTNGSPATGKFTIIRSLRGVERGNAIDILLGR
jgi:hypothetical protein